MSLVSEYFCVFGRLAGKWWGESGAGVECCLQKSGPDFVAVVIEVQVIVCQQVFAGFTGGIETGGPGIDKDGERVCFAEFADELIGFDGFVSNGPAFDAGFDAEEHNFAAAGECLCFVHEQLKVVEHGFGRFAGVEVIVACVEDDGVWFGGSYEAFEEVDGVSQLRAAEAVVDGVESGKGLMNFPAADGGAADEHDVTCWWRAFGERLFEFLDVRFPAFG